jgi:superoxide dismutase
MFWRMLCPPKDYEPPTGTLAKAIERDFGSLETLQTKFSGAAAGVQGSGWGWLGYNKELGKLTIATTSNQDPLQPTTGLIPLLGVDVWEHAYVSLFMLSCHSSFARQSTCFSALGFWTKCTIVRSCLAASLCAVFAIQERPA